MKRFIDNLANILAEKVHMRISKNLPTNPESFKENHPYYVREIKKKDKQKY